LRTAAAPVVPWVPTDLGAALKFWVNADDHGTAGWTDDGAGLMSAVKDRVGNTPFTAATTERPTWSATSFNSAYAALAFDGVANAMVTTTMGAFVTGTTAGCMFLVLSNTSTVAGARIAFAYGSGTAATSRNIQKGTAAAPVRMAVSDQQVALVDTVTLFTGPALAFGSWSGTTETGRLNGQDTTPASTTLTTTINTPATRARLGALTGTTAASFWQGLIRHAIVTTALAALEIQKLEGWGAWDSGIQSVLPAGHPYKSAAP
jgi:hypothetical protein